MTNGLRFYSDVQVAPSSKAEGQAIRRAFSEAVVDLGPNIGPTIPAGPIVAERGQYDDLAQAAVAIVMLCRRTLKFLGDDPVSQMRALGIREGSLPLFTDDLASEIELADAICRADVVVGAEGPQFLEFNVSGAVGGPAESHKICGLWRDVHPGATGSKWDRIIDPLPVLADRMRHLCANRFGQDRIVMVCSLKDIPSAKTYRQFEVLMNALRQAGMDADFVDIDAPEVQAALCSGPRLMWSNFTILEWTQLGLSFDLVRDNLLSGGRMIPSQSAYFLGDKRMFALLSEGMPWMTRSDKALVDRWIPWSRLVQDCRVDFEGASVSLGDLLQGRQDDLVIKHAEGMKSSEVWIGRHCDTPTWRETVQKAMMGSGYIVQRYVKPITTMSSLIDRDGNVERCEISPVISPFVFKGAPAGMWVRYNQDHTRPIVSRYFGSIENVMARG